MATGKFLNLTIEGEETLIENAERISKGLEEMAPQALGEGADVIIALMKKLVPVDEGKLLRSIRFSMGNEGQAKTGTTRNLQRGRTRFIGFIFAGDESTIVEGKGGRKFQNARLQEFGVKGREGSRQPFFYPSFRAKKREARQLIGVIMAGAFRRLKKPQKKAA